MSAGKGPEWRKGTNYSAYYNSDYWSKKDDVVESADATDLKSVDASREGSNPSIVTREEYNALMDEGLEQARLLGMSASRECAMLAQIDKLKHRRALWKQVAKRKDNVAFKMYCFWMDALGQRDQLIVALQEFLQAESRNPYSCNKLYDVREKAKLILEKYEKIQH